MKRTRNLRDAVAELFQAHPNRWVDSREIMRVGGAQAWRTRISEVRRFYQMRIESRVERDRNGVATSLYKYVTPEQDKILGEQICSAAGATGQLSLSE